MAFFEARRSFDRALASDTWTDPAIVTRAVKRRLGLPEPEETAFVSARGSCDAVFVGGNRTQGEIENAAEMLEEIAAGAPSFGENGTQGDIENAAEMLEQIAASAPSIGENGTQGDIENAAEMLEQIAAGGSEATASNGATRAAQDGSGEASNGAGVESSDGEVRGWPLRSQTAQTAYHNSPDGATNNSNSAAPADPPPTEALPPSAAAAAAAAAAAKGPSQPEPRLTHEQYSGLAEGADMDKVVAARVRDTEGMLEALRSAAGSSFEDMALHREESRAHPEAFGQRDWRLKEQSKSHRVMYRPGPEGTAFHELCLEGVLKGSLDTVLAVAWEAPFFIDWWPQFSVPPFHMLESKFVKRVAPGYELVHLRFKVPWPFATREILYVLFSVHDAATGFIATSLISYPDDPATFDPDSYGFSNDGVPRVRSGEVRMSVKGGFASKDLGNGHCYFRGVATIDMKLNLIPPWAINFVSRQLAGSGYHLLYSEVESVADGSNKEADKFRALLRSDPFYYSVGRAMRSHAAAAAAQGERAKQEREQLQQQGEAESFRQIGERVEKHVERLIAITSGSGSEVPGGAGGAGAAAAAAGGGGGDSGVMNAAEALAEEAAAQVPATAGTPKAASPALVARPPRPPSPRRLVAPAQPATAKAAAAGTSPAAQGLQYGQLKQRDPAIYHAVTTLDRAISFMRARAAAQRQAAPAAAGSGAAGLPGLVPPKQEVWSYSGELRPVPRQGESGGDGGAGETGGSGEGGTERVWMLTRTISAGPADHGRGEGLGFETARLVQESIPVPALASGTAATETSVSQSAAAAGAAAQGVTRASSAAAAAPLPSVAVELEAAEQQEGTDTSRDVPVTNAAEASVSTIERPSSAPLGGKGGRDEGRRLTEGEEDAGSKGNKKQGGKRPWRKGFFSLKFSRSPG